MNKHTLGPWKVLDESFQNQVSTGKQLITVSLEAFSSRPSETISLAEIAANARLIAAAPDLLAALKQLSNYIKENSDDCFNKNCPCEGNEENKRLMEIVEQIIVNAEGKII